MGWQLLLKNVADHRNVFWVSDINFEEGLSIPLSASNSVELLSMCEQGIEVMHDFQGLFMRIADVYAHMTDHARRTGDEQVGPGDGWTEGRLSRTTDCAGHR